MTKITFITPFNVLTLNHGGSIRSWNLALQMSTWADVILIHFCEPGENTEVNRKKLLTNNRLKNVIMVPLNRSLLSRSWKLFDLLFGKYSRIASSCVRSRVMRDAIATNSAAFRPDIIFVETVMMSPIPSGLNTPLKVLSHQNLESQLLREIATKVSPWLRGLYRIDAVRTLELEKTYIPTFDVNCFVSELDRIGAKQVARVTNRSILLPNGVDTKRYTINTVINREPATILYLGTYSWLPNVEAVEYFLGNIWPAILRQYPHAIFRIAGSGHCAHFRRWLTMPNVDLVGEVCDVRSLYQQATVMVVPLITGGGTRLKIIEALACGLPVISTSKGVEGIPLRDGQEYCRADAPDGFVKQVLNVLSDDTLRERLSLAGRKYVEWHFAWEAIGSSLKKELVNALAQKH